MNERIKHAWEAYLPSPEIFEEDDYFGYRVWHPGGDPRYGQPFMEEEAIYRTAKIAREAAIERILNSDRLVECAKYDYLQYLKYQKKQEEKAKDVFGVCIEGILKK